MEPQIAVSMENNILVFAIMFLCVLFVSFFSSSEAALISVNRIRLRNLVEKGDKSAKAVERVVSNHDRLFATILATENMLIVLTSSLACLFAVHIFGTKGIIYSTVIVTILIVIFGEITPKTFATQNALRISLLVARPIELMIKCLSPIISVFTFISRTIIKAFGGNPVSNPYFLTEDEIRMIIDDGAKEGVLANSEKQMIEGIFEFSKTLAGDIMIPRVSMVTVAHDAKFSEIINTINETGHSRIPVRKESVDNIIGVLYAKDILKQYGKDLEDLKPTDIMRDCYFAPESQNVTMLLAELREKKTSMAIIIDEFGGTAGLVSIETLVEEIVGDIDDEFDTSQPMYEKIGEDDFLVDAGMSVYDIKELLGIELPEGDYQSVGGFVINLIENIPSLGDVVDYGCYEFIVEKMESYRLSKIRVRQKKSKKR